MLKQTVRLCGTCRRSAINYTHTTVVHIDRAENTPIRFDRRVVVPSEYWTFFDRLFRRKSLRAKIISTDRIVQVCVKKKKMFR